MKSKSSLKSAIKAVAAALCAVSAYAYGANPPQTAFHVSPTGDDSADGSRERPFATVARARDAVRALKKSGALPKGGVNVWLRGGGERRRRGVQGEVSRVRVRPRGAHAQHARMQCVRGRREVVYVACTCDDGQARERVRAEASGGPFVHPRLRAASSRKRDWPARRGRNALPLILSQKAERT